MGLDFPVARRVEVRGISTEIRGQRSEIRKTLAGVHGLPGPKIRTRDTRRPRVRGCEWPQTFGPLKQPYTVVCLVTSAAING